MLSIALCMSGILSINMPSFLKAVNYLSPVRYAIANLAPYTLRGVKLTCEEYQKSGGRCPVETGEQVLGLFGFANNIPHLEIIGVGVATLVYRMLAFVLLKAVRTHWSEVAGNLKARMSKRG